MFYLCLYDEREGYESLRRSRNPQTYWVTSIVREQIEIASRWESNGNKFDVRRGETFHVGSCLRIDNEVSCDCFSDILQDSLVHHVSRYFHGTRILLRKGKCLEKIVVGNVVRDSKVIIGVCILSKKLEQTKWTEHSCTVSSYFPFVCYVTYTEEEWVGLAVARQ